MLVINMPLVKLPQLIKQFMFMPAGSHNTPFSSLKYEGGSICNENSFITPSTNALGFYAIYQTKDQNVAGMMVHEALFIFPNLISYRLFKKHTNIHCIYFPPNCKDSV